MKSFIIAEAGVNHNGDLEVAKKMIDVAANCGADAVKFQTFITHKIVSQWAPKTDYHNRNTPVSESQFEMIKKLELSRQDHECLLQYCKTRNILFLSSPYDLESIDLLDSLGVCLFKIPSAEIINLPYLRKIGMLKKQVIMSTGMAHLHEIREALEVLMSCGTLKQNITVLHCNSQYPTPLEDANLLAMLTLKKEFGVSVGYSDHTQGIEASIAAVAMGACIIEKHFTLDRHMKGPDHSASLSVEELGEMVMAIRNIEKALGSGIKNVSPSESKNRNLLRKSIVAQKDIKKGELLTAENLSIKRPATGINPMKWDEVLNQKAKRNFKADELIEV